ncbi:hypothetical protein IWQ48_004227 [Labrenzia sp. EL_13]|nr:hypothetical protein [Labrenzia sp. EL_13]
MISLLPCSFAKATVIGLRVWFLGIVKKMSSSD